MALHDEASLLDELVGLDVLGSEDEAATEDVCVGGHLVSHDDLPRSATHEAVDLLSRGHVECFGLAASVAGVEDLGEINGRLWG